MERVFLLPFTKRQDLLSRVCGHSMLSTSSLTYARDELNQGRIFYSDIQLLINFQIETEIWGNWNE